MQTQVKHLSPALPVVVAPIFFIGKRSLGAAAENKDFTLKSVARALATALALLGAQAVAQAAGHAHVHGTAKLDIAVEARTISIHLDSPLDNVLGFERAPRTDAERRSADAAIGRLRSAAVLFKIDPAAQCTPGRVDLSSPVLQLGQPAAEAEGEGHADIDGDFMFDCVDATKARYIDVGLFDFARLQALEVQVALPQRAFRRDLKRPSVRISLRPGQE